MAKCISKYSNVTTSVLKKQCTLFRITKDGKNIYHYIPNNDRNKFFRWLKELQGDFFKKQSANKNINNYFGTTSKYEKIEQVSIEAEMEWLYNEFILYIQSSKKTLAKCRSAKQDPLREVFCDWWKQFGGDMNFIDLPYNMDVYWKAISEQKTLEIIEKK